MAKRHLVDAIFGWQSYDLFILSTLLLDNCLFKQWCQPNICQPNVCQPNVCQPNVCQPNVCQPNVCQPNLCQPNAF
jgi:hypothetical protein